MAIIIESIRKNTRAIKITLPAITTLHITVITNRGSTTLIVVSVLMAIRTYKAINL
jgi:hypothetical protein